MTFLPKTSRTLFLIVLSFFIVKNLHAQNASINFDGVDDYIQTNVPPIAGGAARTIEAWIKTTANADPNNGGLQNVIVDMGTMATGSRFTFNVLFNNAIRLEVQGNGLSGAIPINDGLWHHVAGVYNPLATNKVSLYVDGVLDVTGNFTVTANTSPTGDVTIGRRVDGINRFNGNIDEVRIWSVAKTQAELIASMNKELCNAVPSLYSYFTFNDGIPSGNNTNALTYDLTSAYKIGTFVNFNLTGPNSNYAAEKILSAGMTVKKINLAACSTYTWPASGLSYNTAGTYFARSVKGNGCDSIMKLNLSISTIINTSDSVKTCDTFIWSLNGLQYANSGVYVDTVVTSGGCDSIVTLVLNVGVIPPTTQKINACDTYTWNANGITYTNSILTSYTFTNSRGCDSVIYLDLTINKSSNGTQNITNCDKYTWPANGQTYTNSGQYFVTLSTAKGCDSNLTLNLTLNNSYKIIDYVNTCVEYTWAQNGKKYTDNVRDSVVFQNAKGCDSVIVLELKIKKVNVSVTASNILLFAQFAGGTYQWINCNNLTNVVGETNQTFYPSASGTYAVIVTTNGCSDTSNCYEFLIPVGLNNLQSQNLKIYPNPSTDHLFIEGISSNEQTEVQIRNTSGVLFMKENIKEKEVIDISILPQGIYFIKIFEGVFKFVKM